MRNPKRGTANKRDQDEGATASDIEIFNPTRELTRRKNSTADECRLTQMKTNRNREWTRMNTNQVNTERG